MADPFASKYATETYLQSLQASKQDADRALSTALQEITRQRQVGQQAAGQIPGAANTAFDTSQNRLTGDLQSLGLGGPIQSALAAFGLGREGYQKASGHLQEGFNEQGVQRSGSARNIVSSVVADITGKGNEYVSKREQEDRERAYREAEAARQRALQEELARRQYEMQQHALAVQAAEAERQRQFMASQGDMDRQLQLQALAASRQSYTAPPPPPIDWNAIIAAFGPQPGPQPAGAGTSTDFRTRRIL